MAGILDITLERDGHDQPWGFRLQGGYDVGIPLSIQRILVGTPSEGVLKKGDVLLRISKTDANRLTHQQAADLFTNTGNQISIQVKRTGVPQHTVNASTSVAPPQPVPVSGGVPLPGMTTVSTAKSRDTLQLNLPKSRVGIKAQSSSIQHPTSTPLSLTIQNQPYRTSPLIQPSVKVELGPGSSQHLKMQSDYLTGAKDPLPPKDPRAIEFTMKQKVAGTLQNLQYQHPSPPVVGASPEHKFHPLASVSAQSKPSAPPMQSQFPAKQAYNNPIGLYSAENVAEVAKLNKMGMSGAPPVSPTGLLHPNKIQQVVLSPPKDYNPKDSATWQALQESDPTIVDPEKLKNFTSMREHDPIYSEVYEAPKVPRQKSVSPQPPSMKGGPQNLPTPAGSSADGDDSSSSLRQQARSPVPSSMRSPVADLLPAKFGGKASEERKAASSPGPQTSAVLAAAMENSKPVDPNNPLVDLEGFPLYETNSIGGRKKIAQSTTFNKLMMDVLGE